MQGEGADSVIEAIGILSLVDRRSRFPACRGIGRSIAAGSVIYISVALTAFIIAVQKQACRQEVIPRHREISKYAQ